MFDIVVVGTATEDVFVSVPTSKIIQVADADQEQAYLALEYGAKLTVESIFISVGGGSTNTAAGLAACYGMALPFIVGHILTTAAALPLVALPLLRLSENRVKLANSLRACLGLPVTA